MAGQQKQKKITPTAAEKPLPKKPAPDMAGKAAEKTAARQAPEKAAPTATGEAPAKEAPPNLERQIVPQEKTGATPTSSALQTTAVSWGFAPLKTLSGNSLGSLEHYNMDWNEADMDEVTLCRPAGHPAGPSLLTQKMLAVKAAVLEAYKAAEVSTTE